MTWTNISNLETGEQYEMRIVAINGRGDETRSSSKKVQVGPQTGKKKYNLFRSYRKF